MSIKVLLDAIDVEGGSISAVAIRVGVSRTALSLIKHGKYKASPKKILTKIAQTYSYIDRGMVMCPALRDEISVKVCRRYSSAVKSGENIGGTNFMIVRDVCPFCNNF